MEHDERRTVLRFDGSFTGLLCAAQEASTLPAVRRAGTRFQNGVCAEELFDSPIPVEGNIERARAIWRNAAAQGYSSALTICFEAFCSDTKDKEDPIGRMLCALILEACSSGHNGSTTEHRRIAVLDDLADPDMLFISRAATRTRNQAQKIMGLVRFSELEDGLWYASIHPDCDVLPLIGGHFALRFPNMRFMIHDLRRSSAIVHECGVPWRIIDGVSLPGAAGALELPATECEATVREQWRTYFSSIAIGARKNLQLQKKFMPKKYWDTLPEMDTFPRA